MPAASAAKDGSLLLGVAVQELEGLAPSVDHRKTGDGRGLASQGLSPVLELDFQAEEGRPEASPAVSALILKMAAANPLWGAPRIHGELLKLGTHISERTVSRLLPRKRRPPSQTWKAFLDNRLNQLVSIDFFTVPTATFRVLFVLVVLAHRRRRVVHFNVTEHPTAAWTAQQILEALRFGEGQT